MTDPPLPEDQDPSLVLQTASVNTTRLGKIDHSLPQNKPVEESLPAQISIMELLSTSQVHRDGKG